MFGSEHKERNRVPIRFGSEKIERNRVIAVMSEFDLDLVSQVRKVIGRSKSNSSEVLTLEVSL